MDGLRSASFGLRGASRHDATRRLRRGARALPRAVPKFAAKEIEPKIAKWNEQGITDRETWQRMGRAGFSAPCMPEEYGGAGVDFRYDAIIIEELAYMRAHGIMTTVHASICLPYLVTFGTEAQKRKYIPPAVAASSSSGSA